VSEEKNQNQPEHSDPANWEAQLQERANELLAQRIGPLKAEVERLQASLTEITSHLLEQTQTVTTVQETSGLLDYVKQWFNDSTAKAEEDFKSRLEQARSEAAVTARAEAEQAFESRLEQARQQWQAGRPSEEEFQKRLEQACTEAAAVARRQSEVQLEDLREQLEASRKALTLAVSSAQAASTQTANFDAIRAAIEEVDAQRTQSDALTAVVRRAAQFAPRVLFFVVKSGDAVGWKASGFENGLNDETAKLLSVPTQRQTVLREALANFRTSAANSDSTADYSAVLGLYGSPVPERAVAVPLVIRNKAAAVLYADSGTHPETSINTAAIESLMRVAGMVIELLPYRRGAEGARSTAPSAQLTPSAAAAATATAPAPAAEQPVAQAQPESQPEVQPEVRHEAWREVDDETPRQVEPESLPKPEWVAEAAPAAEAETAAKERITVELAPSAPVAESLQQAEAQLHQPSHIEAEPSAVEPETEEITEEIGEPVVAAPPFETFAPPPPPSPPLSAPRPPVSEIPASAPTMPMTGFAAPPVEVPPIEPSAPPFTMPPSPVFTPPAEPPRAAQPVMSVPTPASETEQRAHNDARRFARLLVSEIKLYNAAKVNDGRRNYDLYDRLKEEIDRSRKVYDKRVSPAVASRFDYFYDELVQTLAEGDPAKLGKNCPGPVVLASH
jgi:hypothetical protein